MPNSGYPEGYLCNSIANASLFLPHRFPSLRSPLLSDGNDGRAEVAVFLIDPFVVTEELWAHWALKKSLTNRSPWCITPVSLSKDWVNTEASWGSVHPLPADPCVLGVSQNVNQTGSVCALWNHRITNQVEARGDVKRTLREQHSNLSLFGERNLELMEVKGEIFSISNQRFAFVLPVDGLIWITFLWLLPHQTSMSHFHYAAAERYLLI